MKRRRIPVFRTTDDWLPVTPGQASLAIASDIEAGQPAVRLDFDFAGGAGFVVARRVVRLRLPEAFELRFRCRTDGPPNKLEFKLVSADGKSVWRHERPRFSMPDAGTVVVRSEEIVFGWGPAGGGSPRSLSAIEIALAAEDGGAGHLWLADLECLDRSLPRDPVATASSEAPGHPAQAAFGADEASDWRPARSDPRPWWKMDLGGAFPVGGVVIRWSAGHVPQHAILSHSGDGHRWTTVARVSPQASALTALPLPGEIRCLRIQIHGECPVGIGSVRLRSFDFSRTRDEFFHHVAALFPWGWFPRYFYREQSYWTPVGTRGAAHRAVINEEGMVEVAFASFSLEPFLHVAGRLITWSDVKRSVSLLDGRLPVPTVRWRSSEVDLTVTAVAVVRERQPMLLLRYRLKNFRGKTGAVRLFVAARPFQVSPPWQHWKELGGVSPIDRAQWKDGALWVNGKIPVIPLNAPSAVGVAAFDGSPLTAFLAAGRVPPHRSMRDERGFGGGAFQFDLTAADDIWLAIPFCEEGADATTVQRCRLTTDQAAGSLEHTAGSWRNRQSAVDWKLPALFRDAGHVFSAAIGQILVNRDGPALQPGPRRYTRSWIRDGAIMSAALLRAGRIAEVRDFLRWYASFQRDDGFVPCCVDRDGADPLVEHDSHGQLIFLIAECHRFDADAAFLHEMWSHVSRAAVFLLRLREQKPVAELPLRQTRGLLPPSVSHEGYLAHPVHSYWDDFWAARGLHDAALLADERADSSSAQLWREAAQSLVRATGRSMAAVAGTRHIDTLPASVEWADFDPTATANAIWLFGSAMDLPAEATRKTFDRYLDGVDDRIHGRTDWTNYSAYEVRIVGALVRLGDRDRAADLLGYFLAQRRPRAWQQWPEITWRQTRWPGHLGDVPHTWIAAEFMLAFASLFAFERTDDEALVLAAGIPLSWVPVGETVGVRGLRTWFGALDLTLHRFSERSLHLKIGGALRCPPGGLVLRPPLPGPIEKVTVEPSAAFRLQADEVHIAGIDAVAVIVECKCASLT